MTQISNRGKLTLAGLAGLFIVGAYGLWTAVPDTWKNTIAPSAEGQKTATSSFAGDQEVMDVCVVTWGGYAGGQLFNGGFKPNDASRYLKNYNIKVNFQVIDDFNASRDAWKTGNCDVLWTTVDSFATEAATLKSAGQDPVLIFQADWSRGGDAIVAKAGINTMRDLRGKKVAVAYGTPSHTFMLRMLQADGMSIRDINLINSGSAIDAAKQFQTGNVDAAVVWSPDDEASVRAIPGSKVMVSTRTASHIIADAFFVNRPYLEKHRKELQSLVEGWMIGNAELTANTNNARSRAAAILAAGLNLSEADAQGAMNNVRFATYGDNTQFFGITSGAVTTGERLYRESAMLYQQNGYTDLVPTIPDWRSIIDLGLLRALNLSGSEHSAEGMTRFTTPTNNNQTAFTSLALSVTFPSGSAVLDDAAKLKIQTDFAPTARSFANARIRIEGNTDSTGSAATNTALSRARAQAVAKYLEQEFGFDTNRFIVIGNGPSKPLCTTTDAGCFAQNRRTDFELLQ